ncbi:MAG: carboxylate-amine ligase [Rhodospirillaceae bacterium]|jgi:glutamate---cysteine ligase / carboxylate-amine ligase|nr:carboxylate-amine ligase [Rhodospirillaceae bacterium]MBT6205840.1 carboxylate-amine ligase [Rhodospirillaceae bacterium]MBT6509662.1 carboxylate-amine ligase [Rhodospirillaceae bacterium]MBT7615185.1 carboxylate-amine ligase [Rhodospirillaceae bacterium]
MAVSEPAFTMGVEEEYLLVDKVTGELASDPPESLVDECAKVLGEQVSNEFLRAQVEIGTRVCKDISEVREELKRLRSGVIGVADGYGLAPIASSTHPFGDWRNQDYVQKERYEGLARDMQAVAHRLLICGMHVHVGIEDEELRIDLMNQVRYFLPHLLCLTTSSPFWQGRDTGLKSYRLTVFDALPRTGLPEPIASWSEYQRMIQHMTSSGRIHDGSKIWWDLRPSSHYPTLEMRICDVCPDMEGALTVAALFQCILRMLYRLRIGNQRWREYPNMLVQENRWLAQRYGSSSELVDFGKRSLVPLADLIDEVLELTAEDAEALGCTAEVQRARLIVQRGTAAERQLSVFEAAGGAAAGDDAFRAVVLDLVEQTAAGTS